MILHTSSSIDEDWGGLSVCVATMMKHLHSEGAELLSYRPKDSLIPEGASWAHLVADDTRSPYKYSANVKRELKRLDADIYHAHGLWLYINHATCEYARKKGKPYIITPHGMLYPQALQRSSFRKRIARKLLFDEDIRRATVLHATSQAEADYIRELGFKTPIALIPNPIEIPEGLEQIKVQRVPRRIGYLGRLHPWKNLELLIESFAAVGREDAELYLMGSGDAAYVAKLHKLVRDLGLHNVVFTGHLSGMRRYELLSTLSALAVVSRYENFCMSAAEALLCGTPVIAVKTSPWEALQAHRCGSWIDYSEIVATMRRYIDYSPEIIAEMGERGKALIKDNYRPEKIAASFVRLYGWLRGENETPEFVI
jgi:glycosyltransferase involved in cell wall biosynthesis